MWIIPINGYLALCSDATYHSIVNICIMYFAYITNNYNCLILQPIMYYSIDMYRCIRERDTMFMIHHIASLVMSMLAWINRIHLFRYTVVVKSVMFLEFSGLLVNMYHLSDKTMRDRVLLACTYIPIRIMIVPYMIVCTRVIDFFDLVMRTIIIFITIGSYVWSKKILTSINDYITKKPRFEEEVASDIS